MGPPLSDTDILSVVGQKMSDRILLVMARRTGRWIAGAINFIGSDTLFGRHWGAIEHHPFLHFELRYYQAIEYAIEHGLDRVEAEPKASKLPRGYLPTDDLFAPISSPTRACVGPSRITCRVNAPMWQAVV